MWRFYSASPSRPVPFPPCPQAQRSSIHNLRDLWCWRKPTSADYVKIDNTQGKEKIDDRSCLHSYSIFEMVSHFTTEFSIFRVYKTGVSLQLWLISFKTTNLYSLRDRWNNSDGEYYRICKAYTKFRILSLVWYTSFSRHSFARNLVKTLNIKRRKKEYIYSIDVRS